MQQHQNVSIGPRFLSYFSRCVGLSAVPQFVTSLILLPLPSNLLPVPPSIWHNFNRIRTPPRHKQHLGKGKRGLANLPSSFTCFALLAPSFLFSEIGLRGVWSTLCSRPFLLTPRARATNQIMLPYFLHIDSLTLPNLVFLTQSWIW